MRKPLREPSGSTRGTRKQERPAGACASTRNASLIGAEQNHLCPSSTYSPPPSGRATVVFVRTSEPPCRSVIAMPHERARFSAAGRRPKSYSRDVSSGSHSAASAGADARSAGTAACVIEIGQPWPASTCAASMKSAARATCAPSRVVRPGERVQAVARSRCRISVVPRRMELDLVDARAEAVVRAELRRVLVREPAPLERRAAEPLPNAEHCAGRPARALPLERLDERPIRGEQVVAGERRHLVGAPCREHRHTRHDTPLREWARSASGRLDPEADGRYSGRARTVSRRPRRARVRPPRVAARRPAHARREGPDPAAPRRARRAGRPARVLLGLAAVRPCAPRRARRAHRPRPGRRVGLGSSLGALALLHAHRLEARAFSGLFLQSGSFFRRRTDAQESRFPRFARVDRFVGSVLNARDSARPVPATITCALDEENYGNNAALAHALAAQGYPVDFHAARGGHDWATWRRAVEAHLPPLLRKVWR